MSPHAQLFNEFLEPAIYVVKRSLNHNGSVLIEPDYSRSVPMCEALCE